jgi:hypothetical protein
LLLTAPGRDLAQQFFSSLRIAKPQPVSVNIPSFAGPSATHGLLALVSGMIAETSSVTLDEPDRAVPDAATASRIAGFAAALPRERRDRATLIVTGAHAVTLAVNRAQLRTIFAEAGVAGIDVAPALNGAVVTIKTPRSIRAQYGHCPAPVVNSLQNQLQGPPPPSADNGDCVVLSESPAAMVDVPPSLDLAPLVVVALELSGMSPNETQAFQRTVDSRSALTLSLPRFLRSYDSVDVGGAKGMLLNTAGRRGPTYVLIWVRNGLAYSLSGYGSAADAAPLAKSTN